MGIQSHFFFLFVFAMPGIVLCRHISAQYMFVGWDLKHELVRVVRLVSAVFLPSHCPSEVGNVQGILLGIFCNPQFLRWSNKD